jgi:hypothetical protein
MREANSTVARRPLLPLTLLPFVALLLAMSLGGCVAYSGYPGYYGYNYNYPAAYPNYYADYTYRPRPYYSSDYNSSFNTYENSGGGGH